MKSESPSIQTPIQEKKNSATADSRAQVQTLLLKLAPEILDVTRKLQSVLDLKTASNPKSENLYAMSTAVEKICKAWKQSSLEITVLSENSSSIINFFLKSLPALFEAHPGSEILFKMEIQLFTLIDKIYDLLDKPITLYPSQLLSKYYQALYFFSHEEIDAQAAIQALTKVLLFNSHNSSHQLEKIYLLDQLSVHCRNIIKLRNIPHKEQFSEIFLNFSREMMTMFLQVPTADSKTYSSIIHNVLEVAIFCQEDRNNVEDLISGLRMLISANKLTELSEQQCIYPLKLIIQFIADPQDAAGWLSILLINIGEQLTSRISTPQIIGYRSILAGFKQNHTSPQTGNTGSTTQKVFDLEKLSVLKPRIIKNITDSQNKLRKIYQKKKSLQKPENSNDDKSSLEPLPILKSLTELGNTLSKFPKGMEVPEMLKQIPAFFLQVISSLDTMSECDEFKFKLNLFDCIEEVLSLFSIDSKVQFFKFQCYFLNIRELLSRTNPDIEKIKVLVEKLAVDSCDPERLRDHQLLIFGVCESHLQKFNDLKISQEQDKFIAIITFLAQKIIHIHEKNPARIVETVHQILAIASFFLCAKGCKSARSPLIQKAEEIVLNLNRIVLNYEKSNALLPSMEECLSILKRLNKIMEAAESLNNLNTKLLNWLLQTGKVFFLKKLYHHADLSKFQKFLNKQQEQKIRDIPLNVPEISVQKEKKQDSPLIETIQKEINQKNAELLNLTNKNETLKNEVRTLNSSLTKNSKKYQTAVTQIEDLNQKIQASEQRILQLEQDLAKTEKQLLAQKTENEQIIPELKHEIKKGGEVQNDLRLTCQSLTLNKTELQEKLEILTTELRKQKEDNSQMLQKHNKEINQKNAELLNLTNKNETLKKEIRTLNFSLTKNRKKYQTAVTQIEDLNQKIQASEQRILQLEQDLEKAEKQLLAQKTENEQIIPELKNEIKKGGEVQNDLRLTCHSLTLDKTELQEKLEILTTELRKQKEDNSQMLQKHNQALNSHEAEIALITQKYEAEKKADERAKTKQFLSLHQEIARLKIKAGEAGEQSQEFRPWCANFQFSSEPGAYLPSFSPPNRESEEQVFGY